MTGKNNDKILLSKPKILEPILVQNYLVMSLKIFFLSLIADMPLYVLGEDDYSH